MLMENFTRLKVGCVRSLPGMGKGRDGTDLRDPDIVPGQPPIHGCTHAKVEKRVKDVITFTLNSIRKHI